MIVGLVGKKHSGKSSSAKYLHESKGYRIVSFAEPLKMMLKVFLKYRGCPDDLAWRMLWGDLKEAPSPYFNGKTSRWAQQTLGTEWGRELIDPYLWTNAWQDHIETARYESVVIDDVRFQTEVDRIRELGGICIRINRPGDERAIPTDLHPSETNILTDIKYNVENDGSFVHLYEQLKLIMDIERYREVDPNQLQLLKG